jgi:hypothetical protein
MRGWTFLLAGPIVWTVHFFALYGIASIFLTSTTSRVLTGLVSLGCLAAIALLFVRVRGSQPVDDPDAWTHRVSLLAIGLSGIAIFWQTLPALLG